MSQRNPLIPAEAEPRALQAILFFVMAKAAGESRSEAVARFVGSPLCEAFGDRLTVGNVYGFAQAGGYDD
jgi:hypothetical protein